MGRKKDTVSQSEAMRQALKALGFNAPNKELAEYILENHALTVKNISVLKSNQKKILQQREAADNGDTTRGSRATGQKSSGAYPANTITLLQELADRVGGMEELARIVEKLT